jgi:hypothetical protein
MTSAAIPQTGVGCPLEGYQGTIRATEGETQNDNASSRVCRTRHPAGIAAGPVGLIVTVGQVRIVADRAGLLGGVVASLTCGGGAAAAARREAMAQMLRPRRDRAEEAASRG